MCRQIRPDCLFRTLGKQQCIDCAFLEEKQFGETLETEFLKHCRDIREFIEQTAGELFSAHVASILLTASANVLDCDFRGRAFLFTGGILRISNNKLRCCDHRLDIRLNGAITATIKTGQATTLLLAPPDRPLQRYSVVFVSLAKRTNNLWTTKQYSAGSVLCLVAPLDRRRFATARQLMDLFGLSAAEARLARALCHGDSLEEYTLDHGLKLPTVKTQLRSIFAKTGTERQASLIRLISGVPVIRDDQSKPLGQL
jgi:DNA-binding CsgD family transcriptional regulator